MPVPTLSPDGASALDAFLKATVDGRDVPAVFLGATNAKETIYFNQAGEKRFGDEDQGYVTEDTTTELFSQSKFVTCVAMMQLVEQGKIGLDSAEHVVKFAPELGKLQLSEGVDENDMPILVQPKNKITLRMLMSHSAGLNYTFLGEPTLARWSALNPLPSMLSSDASVACICTPLIYEPGTSWRYSVSIDWVGVLIERISGLRLEQYFRKHLFDRVPGGCETLTFYPTEEIKAKKMSVCTRDANGKVVPIKNGFGMGRNTEADKVSKSFLSGGGGLFGTQKDYLAFLRAMLQCDPKNGVTPADPLLSPESYKQLFTPSLPPPDKSDARTHIRDMVDKPKYFDPPVRVDNVDHSIACLINLEDWTGRRKAFSGCWSGAAKTQFWVDPTTGLAGVCGTQLLSPAPDPWYARYSEYERILYQHLR